MRLPTSAVIGNRHIPLIIIQSCLCYRLCYFCFSCCVCKGKIISALLSIYVTLFHCLKKNQTKQISVTVWTESSFFLC